MQRTPVANALGSVVRAKVIPLLRRRPLAPGAGSGLSPHAIALILRLRLAFDRDTSLTFYRLAGGPEVHRKAVF